MRLRRLLLILIVAVGSLAGCAEQRGVNLDDLVIQDSTYFEPASQTPYSGPVFRPFPDDAEKMELTGTLHEGAFNGELTVYHANGTIRFQGELVEGTKCGTWFESQDDEDRESLYEAVVKDIESMSLYPPCPGS